MSRIIRLLAVIACGLSPCCSVRAATLYVAPGSLSPAAPFGDWSSAAHTIQDAVDAAQPYDTILVTNGLYATGGRVVYGAMTNRVAVTMPLTLQSVNGPGVTLIQGRKVPGTIFGDSAVRCVYLTNGAVLIGFTLSNGATRDASGNAVYEQMGGGVWGTKAVLSNCTLIGNSAYNDGGGAAWATLNNCTLLGNTAGSYGGGSAYGALNNCRLISNTAGTAAEGGGAAYGSLTGCLVTGNRAGSGGGVSSATLTNCALVGNAASAFGGGSYYSAYLVNCTVVSNSAAYQGGGSYYDALVNCILYYNTAPDSPNYVQDDYAYAPIDYSCTLPLPTNGTANLAGAPLFLDYAGGNLRLQSNSPCVDSGLNSAVRCPRDLDGRPRLVSGLVDQGAYEYQTNASGLFIAWLGQFGLPTDGSADYADSDGDWMNNYQEWVAATDPTNALSCLRLALISSDSTRSLGCSSAATRLYTLWRCTDLGNAAGSPANPAWETVPGQIDIPGTDGPLTLTDSSPPPTAFYRVSVRFP